MAIITAEQFKQKAFNEVQIPGFEQGETITVCLRRVSVLGLASSGKIPNALQATVNKLFASDSSNAKEVSQTSLSNFNEMGQLLDIIAREAMVSPTFDEVGEYLTDDQKNAIFGYSQTGIVSLTPIATE